MQHIVLGLLLTLSSIGYTQNCNLTLSGQILDMHDNSTLSGATIAIVGTNIAVQTGLEGRYRIENLCQNNLYNIKVIHPACDSQIFSLRLNKNTTKDFKLEHHLEELNEIIVDGSLYDVKSNSTLENKVSKETLEQYKTGTLADALKSISGISTLAKGNAIVKPVIHGLHSSRIVMVNNGVRMMDQEWGADHAPNIDINSVERLIVIKNASALQYSGDAIGGVIISEAVKVPLLDSIYGQTSLSGQSNGRGGMLTTQFTKTSANGWFGTFQGAFKRFGDFEASEYVLSNTGLTGHNAALRFGLNQFQKGFEVYYSYTKNSIGILRASHLHGAADQVRALSNDRPLIVRDFTYNIDAPSQEVGHHLFRLKGFKTFENFGEIRVQYDFQQNNRLEYDIRRGDDMNKAALDLRLNTHSVLVDFEAQTTHDLGLKLGVMGRYQNNFPNPNTGVRRLIPDYDKYDFGIYGIVDHKANERWHLEAGIRYDYSTMDVFKYYRTSFWESRNYDELYSDLVVEDLGTQVATNPILTFHNISATLGAKYRWGHFNVLMNYAMASRAPNPSELFSEGLHHAVARIERGDLSFDSEISHKFSLALQRQSDRFGFTINPYINSVSDFILIEPTSVLETIRGNFQVWEYRQTQAQLMGIDIDAQIKLSQNFNFKHQLAMVQGVDKSRDLPLINVPPVHVNNEISYNNAKFHNLRMSLKSEYVSSQNKFPDTNFEVYIPLTDTTETVDMSTPPGAYHLIHFNSSVEFELKTALSLTVGLGVTNLFNTSYRNYLNLQRFYADDLGRNIVLNLKLNY